MSSQPMRFQSVSSRPPVGYVKHALGNASPTRFACPLGFWHAFGGLRTATPDGDWPQPETAAGPGKHAVPMRHGLAHERDARITALRDLHHCRRLGQREAIASGPRGCAWLGASTQSAAINRRCARFMLYLAIVTRGTAARQHCAKRNFQCDLMRISAFAQALLFVSHQWREQIADDRTRAGLDLDRDGHAG